MAMCPPRADEPIDLGELEGEASKLDSIFGTRMSFSSLPQVQSNGSISSIPHIQIPLPENPLPSHVSLEPPHETTAFRQNTSSSSLFPSQITTRGSSRNLTPHSHSPLPAAFPSTAAAQRSAAAETLSSLAVIFPQDEQVSETESEQPARAGSKRRAETGRTAAKQATVPPPEKRKKIFVAGDSPNGDLFLAIFPVCSAGLSVFVSLITEDSGDDDDEEKKRNAHVNAEQKRRDNIKTGFGELKVLLPQFKDKGNVSKAVLLRGAIDYIAQLVDVREEVLQLRRENEELRKAAGYHLLFSLFSLFSFFFSLQCLPSWCWRLTPAPFPMYV